MNTIKRIERFNSKLVRQGDCLVWTGYSKGGRSDYGMFCKELVHIFAYKLYKGNVPSGIHVLHTCDVKKCCNPDHLYLGTESNNARDRYERGLAPKGDNHWTRKENHRISRGETRPFAKLTNKQADEARLLRAEGLTVQSIADSFGISRRQMTEILKNRAYKNG